ncbi:MAG: DUF4115 domain-containing protein [Arenicellales bacterium]|nr:DUF4115 domain-containing protein [Arenicellales bacterium]MDP6671646.1 DUF4115 domain-containing protein [Arenicellales bacterium]MDP6724434.1 DUF4115 domain-containing protein [Arenicellales bacterium]
MNSEKKPSNSPGALLRWGREQRNLSIEEIASELHLTKVRVIAIEEDDFSSFSGETFVRGYLRLYARVIGIDEKEVVGLIDPDLLSHNMAQQRFVQPVVSHVGMNHTGLKLATWVIAIVFVGLLLVWWLDRDDGLDERIPLNSEGTTRMAESVEGVSDLAEPVTAQPQPEKTPPSADPVVVEPPSSEPERSAQSPEPAPAITPVLPSLKAGKDKDVVEEGGSEADQGGVVATTGVTGQEPEEKRLTTEKKEAVKVEGEGDAPADTSADPNQEIEKSKTQPEVRKEAEIKQTPEVKKAPEVKKSPEVKKPEEVKKSPSVKKPEVPKEEEKKKTPKEADKPKAAPAKSEAAEKSTPQPEIISDDLRLVFEGGSWAAVQDATGKKLLYKFVTQGQSMTLRGKPPYNIFLGNAAGVKIDFRGKPVKIIPDPTGLYSRFEVGGGSD